VRKPDPKELLLRASPAEIERLCVRNLLANPEERLYFKDLDSRFIAVSEGFLKGLTAGWSVEQVIGKTDFDIFSRPHAEAAFIDEQGVIETGEPLIGKIERETFADRPDAWVSTTKLPLRDEDGRIVGTYGISRDVTAQIEAEQERSRAAAELAVARDQALQASNLKSSFLANVSHEIRTPMNGVLGLAELLLDMELTSDQRDYVEQIARSGEQMLAILNDVLDLSKIESGRLELDIADFDLHDAVLETCAIARPQARNKQLELDVTIDDGVPQRVRGDGRRLMQILLNLATNAVKFTPQGKVSVSVSAEPVGGRRSRVSLAVADSGIGIEPSALERLFEPFTQADATTTRKYGGTGLGLSISRELIEMMGGTITATSEPDVGSTFRFELELELASKTRSLAAAAGAGRGWATPPLILVVEDSPVNQIVVTRTLERIGCRSVVVGDGREAVAAIRRRRFDAVLMDCHMPLMDGFEATAAIRRLRGGVGALPIIAMTARAMDDDRNRCLAAGMDDYVSKPVRRATLREILQRWIPASSSAGRGRRSAAA
jgi:PAS domain S-box-containing protein